jgi:hypothetical protein
MRGNGDGRRGSSDRTRVRLGDPFVDLAHLKSEIERRRTLRAEGVYEVEYEFDLTQTGKRFGFSKRKFRQFVERSPGSVSRSGDGPAPVSVDEANKLVDGVKPELIVETANLPAAAAIVRDALAATGYVFEWGVPAKVVSSRDGELPQIVPLTVENVVAEIHELRRPIKLTLAAGERKSHCLIGWRSNTLPRKASGS